MNRRVTPEIAEAMNYAYTRGVPIARIADEFNLSEATVNRWIMYYGWQVDKHEYHNVTLEEAKEIAGVA